MCPGLLAPLNADVMRGGKDKQKNFDFCSISLFSWLLLLWLLTSPQSSYLQFWPPKRVHIFLSLGHFHQDPALPVIGRYVRAGNSLPPPLPALGPLSCARQEFSASCHGLDSGAPGFPVPC